MSAEENKALAGGWNKWGFANFEAYDEFLHENYTLYDATERRRADLDGTGGTGEVVPRRTG